MAQQWQHGTLAKLNPHVCSFVRGHPEFEKLIKEMTEFLQWTQVAPKPELFLT